MENNLIIVGSVTYAIKAKELLFSKNIKAYIERNRNTREFGCGYGVYVPKEAYKAFNILNESGIRVLAFVRKEDMV